MSNRAITIRAEWDDDAGVWSIYSDDVPGLNIEADRYEDIERKAVAAISDLAEFAPEVAALNGAALDIVAHRHTQLAVA